MSYATRVEMSRRARVHGLAVMHDVSRSLFINYPKALERTCSRFLGRLSTVAYGTSAPCDQKEPRQAATNIKASPAVIEHLAFYLSVIVQYQTPIPFAEQTHYNRPPTSGQPHQASLNYCHSKPCCIATSIPSPKLFCSSMSDKPFRLLDLPVELPYTVHEQIEISACHYQLKDPTFRCKFEEKAIP